MRGTMGGRRRSRKMGRAASSTTARQLLDHGSMLLDDGSTTTPSTTLPTGIGVCDSAAVMPRRVAPEEIEAVFAEDGPLATLMPGYIPRRSQIDMALAVARTLDTPRGRLAVEAGTGTGKSLAYLVPALLSERRVVVATGTKALQDQLVDKDAPIAVAAVSALRGDDVTQTVLRMKGRNNYLCRLRWESFDRQSAFDFGNDTLVQIKRFAETTTTGDRAELVGLPDSFSLWADLDANRDTCLGQACPRYDDCYVVTLRRQAESAAVIVVNHHLLCADQRLRLESGGFDDGDNAGFGVLPVMDALIVDEAHSLPDVATDHFGLSVSTDEVGKLLIDVRRAADSCGGSERASLMDAVDEVRAAAEAFFLAAANTGRREGARDSLRPGEPVRGERLNLVGSDDLRR
ncbi:MAG TPA: ATP-dependent DNA helicase, partial [Myxococcota bacterium]